MKLNERSPRSLWVKARDVLETTSAPEAEIDFDQVLTTILQLDRKLGTNLCADDKTRFLELFLNPANKATYEKFFPAEAIPANIQQEIQTYLVIKEPRGLVNGFSGLRVSYPNLEFPQTVLDRLKREDITAYILKELDERPNVFLQQYYLVARFGAISREFSTLVEKLLVERKEKIFAAMKKEDFFYIAALWASAPALRSEVGNKAEEYWSEWKQDIRDLTNAEKLAKLPKRDEYKLYGQPRALEKAVLLALSVTILSQDAPKPFQQIKPLPIRPGV